MRDLNEQHLVVDLHFYLNLKSRFIMNSAETVGKSTLYETVENLTYGQCSTDIERILQALTVALFAQNDLRTRQQRLLVN